MEITKTRAVVKPIKWQTTVSITFVIASTLLTIFWVFPYFNENMAFGSDWIGPLRNGARFFLQGNSPYSARGFFSPPWVLPLLIPFSFLPPLWGLFGMILVNLYAAVIVLRKMKASWAIAILFVLTPQLLWAILHGNIDCLVMLGFIMPPQVGLFFVLAKPQIGIGIATFWIIEAWRKGGLREVVKMCTPFGIVFILSFAIFGWWPKYLMVATGREWNVSNWPYLLPIGVILLIKAIRDRKQGMSITAGVFLSPYISWDSIPLAILGLLPNELETIAAIMSMWVVWIIQTSML